MKNAACREFLAWALPRLALSPPAYRRVCGQVCKRITRRMRQLDLAGYGAYRALLEDNEDEWRILDSLCRITVTRFLRERDAWIELSDRILPDLAGRALRAGRQLLRAWSAGCGGGEEPYSLRLLWEVTMAARFPSLRLEIVATDADAAMLRRARTGVYRRATLREVPQAWIARGFDTDGDWLRLRPACRAGIRFAQQDIRATMPDGPFDLVLCRYIAFTYFDSEGRRAALHGILRRLRPGGILMIGVREDPPAWSSALDPVQQELGFWRRRDGP